MEKKIVVLAKNMEHFKYWLRNNIIPITTKQSIEKLHGIKIEKIYIEGEQISWLDSEVIEILEYFENRS